MQKINIKNKRASFEFEFIEKFIAGIQLFGTEIKSIRSGKASLVDAFCSFTKDELYVIGMHISEYKFGSYYNHEEKRERKLLLNRKELNKLDRKTKESGLTIIPLRIFINDKGFAKMEIALCRGKKHYDKRESLKQRDHKREIDRMMKR
nr:SsrA-binding protein [uncultured Marinifilum sp.]